MTTQTAANVIRRIKRKMKLLLNVSFDRTTNVALWQALNVTSCKTDRLTGADELVFTMLQQEETH